MTAKSGKTRLDVLLVDRGLADSRQKAQAMILAGEVLVDGVRVEKAGHSVRSDARIEVSSRLQKYVGRGGFKLEGALSDFGVNPAGKTCLDVGGSTGGFTDCLLQHGAVKVFAVDVNVAQMAWKLQQDPRVFRVERNARELNPEDVTETVDLVVIDVSFISVTKVLAPAIRIANINAEFLILVKPQFELRKEQVGSGGIVTEERLQQEAVSRVWDNAIASGLECKEVRPSHLRGAEGNQEFFLYARKPS